MRVIITLDEARLRHYASRGRDLSFGLALEHEGEYYPSPDWIDFGEVILAWWLAALLRLARGAQEDQLPFMDGPYTVWLRYDRSTDTVDLSPVRRDFRWTLTFAEFASALVRGAEVTRRELAKLGYGEGDRESLSALIRMVRTAIPASPTE